MFSYRSVVGAIAVSVLLSAVADVSAARASSPTLSPASLLGQVSTFGSPGSGTGQLNGPTGVSVDQRTGNVYVADSANARVEKFDPSGGFLAAWGWGVRDGRARTEVCTSNCQAGVPGPGAGQFSRPTSVAVAESGKVYVGDAGNNVVDGFDARGRFLAATDGSTSPQGSYSSLAGVAVDQSGNLWTADATTDNVDEFDADGAFLQQWSDTHGSPSAIAVDSADDAVYLTTGGLTESWTLTGSTRAEVDRPIFFGSAGFSGPSASALALDPRTGNLYVDYAGDGSYLAVYDRAGIQLDSLSLGSTTNSEGLAFTSDKGGSRPGHGDLYVADATNDAVAIYGPQRIPAPPLVTAESATQTGDTSATLAAGVVPLGHDTTCDFQYVDNANFQASGYDTATTVACAPADLGSSFKYQAASASVSGLVLGAYYHFRVVAASSAGTTTGADQELQAGPGAWAPFGRCPVDRPRMLGTDGGTTKVGLCVASNSTHGSITLGSVTATTGNTNLQVGIVENSTTGSFAVVPPPSGSIVADPALIPGTPVGTVTAVTESAGSPSHFSLFAGISMGEPVIKLPIKVHLENPALGPNCFIGSNQNPIILRPENIDLSNAQSIGGFFTFDPNGPLDPTGPLQSLLITGAVQGDDTFAVPGAQGCGPNGDGSLDGLVNSVVGLPSPAGNNHLVLDDVSSALVSPVDGENGQAFANAWHSAFG